jgi:hypothetical protein
LRFSTWFARKGKVVHGLIVLSLASANDRRNALGVAADPPKRLAHLKEDSGSLDVALTGLAQHLGGQAALLIALL